MQLPQITIATAVIVSNPRLKISGRIMGRKIMHSSGAPMKESNRAKMRIRNGTASSCRVWNFFRTAASAAGMMPSSLMMPNVPPTTSVMKIMLAAFIKPAE